MGGPCDILIPAAVLYDNPEGLSFEEFYKKVNLISGKVGSGDIDWWKENRYLFSGQILNLPLTKEYEETEKSNYNTELKYFRERFDGLFDMKVIKKQHTLLEDKVIFNVETDFTPKHHEGYSVGDYLDETEKTYWAKGIPEKYMSDASIEIRITSVIEKDEPILVDYEKWEVNQKLEGIPINFYRSEEKFKDENEVALRYPKYSLNNVYDFSSDSGWLFPSSVEGTKAGLLRSGPGTFRWNMREGKYFLDKEYMFSHLSPNSVYSRDSQSHWSAYSHIDLSREWIHPENGGIFSFSDLILTSEAIKKENWNLLGYTGNRHELLKFLYNNEDSLCNYENSVLETELYMLAKKSGWTNSEYIRAHMEMCRSRTHLDLEVARIELENFRNKELKTKRKWEEKCKKDRLEEEKNELPF
jgi:hypothetical protein